MSDDERAVASPGHFAWVPWAQRAIGPAVLVALLYSTDLDALLEAFARARPVLLLCAYPLVLPAVALRAWRWQVLLRELGRTVGYFRTLSAYGYAIFVGTVTPGRVGEFIKAAHLTRHGWTTGRAVASVVMDRLYDVSALLGAACAGLVVLWLDLKASGLAVAGALALPCLGAAVARSAATSPRLTRWLSAASPQGPQAIRVRIGRFGGEMLGEVARIGAGRIAAAVLLTITSWAVNYAANYLFGLSLNLQIGYLDMLIISAVSSLVTLVPVSVLGVGTRDAALVVLLARYGATQPDAIALSTLFLSLNIWAGVVGAASLLTGAARLDWRAQAQSDPSRPTGQKHL